MTSVAIVTGAASGIGRALTEELVKSGTTVVMADINETLVHEVAGILSQAGGRVKPVVVDVTNAEMVKKVVQDTVAEFGKLDYMFNNAGIAIIGDARAFTLEDWNKQIRVNIDGVVYGVAAAYEVMVKQGFGHIVNTASMAGLIPTPFLTAYSATKHAVVGLSISLRSEAAHWGVKVSAVCPGFIETSIKQNAKFVGMEQQSIDSAFKPRYHPAKKCARDILHGVRKNRAIIVVTGYAKFVRFLYRYFPNLVLWKADSTTRDVFTLLAKGK